MLLTSTVSGYARSGNPTSQLDCRRLRRLPPDAASQNPGPVVLTAPGFAFPAQGYLSNPNRTCDPDRRKDLRTQKCTGGGGGNALRRDAIDTDAIDTQAACFAHGCGIAQVLRSLGRYCRMNKRA